MNILFVYPEYPDTFWSFKYALKLIFKKAAFPPLGAITVAAMLPKEWNKKLLDLNVESLSDKMIKWADYVFISAMGVQKHSAKQVIARVKRLGTKVVAGGPLFTSEPEQFGEVDYLVLNEAEVTLPVFLKDLEKGAAKHIYSSNVHPPITSTPTPLWSLLKMRKYSSMSIQYSRGCPFNCEFCDIVYLNGRIPLTKSKEQFIAELQSLYRAGWRGAVFIVDDNFIGNKKKLKEEILPATIVWQTKRRHPFDLLTEGSINLADDEELMNLMVKAGFTRIFVGIETPNEESLLECNKGQNTKRDLAESVKIIINHGMEVMGGFILGFDNDPRDIFERQVAFIQKTGIVTAMVGLLTALKGTNLYQRLAVENRLLKESTGDNMDVMNFIPKMDKEFLLEGYRRVILTIYSPERYYERVKILLKECKPNTHLKIPSFKSFPWYYFPGGFNSFLLLGILGKKGKRYFWKTFFFTLFKMPLSMPTFLTLSVYWHHFWKVTQKYIQQGQTETA